MRFYYLGEKYKNKVEHVGAKAGFDRDGHTDSVVRMPSAQKKQRWIGGSNPPHKAPQQHPSVLSDSPRHHTQASTSFDRRQAFWRYMLFSLP